MSFREDLFEYVKTEYGTALETPWADDPISTIFRHKRRNGEKQGKWYGLTMRIRRSLLEPASITDREPEAVGLPFVRGKAEEDFSLVEIGPEDFFDDGLVDVLNVKCEPVMVDLLCTGKGYYPAYHMNKKHWITVLLDGTVPFENICQLIDMSYALTDSGRKKGKKVVTNGPRDWLIPANPKIFDVVGAMETQTEIDWKQSSDVRVGDLVYMYVGLPNSALMYKFRATKVNIPWEEDYEGVVIKRLMRLELLCSYGDQLMPLQKMREEFGIYGVRGPRSIPNSLKAFLSQYEN